MGAAQGDRARYARDPFCQVAGVSFSKCGENMAGVLETGTCAVWAVEGTGGSYAVTDGGAAGAVAPLWCHRCFSRRGSAVTFLGASSTVVATAGLGQQQRSVALWDTAAPAPQPVAVLEAHGGDCRGVCVSPSGTLLFTAGGDGTVAAWDVRQLGGAQGGSPVAVLEVGDGAPVQRLAAGSIRVRGSEAGVVAAGSADGGVWVWEAGGLEEVVGLRRLHTRKASMLERWGLGEGEGSGVTGLQVASECVMR